MYKRYKINLNTLRVVMIAAFWWNLLFWVWVGVSGLEQDTPEIWLAKAS